MKPINDDELDAMFKRNWDEYMKLLDELSDENGILHAKSDNEDTIDGTHLQRFNKNNQ